MRVGASVGAEAFGRNFRFRCGASRASQRRVPAFFLPNEPGDDRSTTPRREHDVGMRLGPPSQSNAGGRPREARTIVASATARVTAAITVGQSSSTCRALGRTTGTPNA